MSLLKQIRCLCIRNSRPINICRGFSKKLELSEKLRNGPSLSHFISPSISAADLGDQRHIPYIKKLPTTPRKVFFDVYGCQMNVNDTEIVWSILKDEGYTKTEDPNEADVFLVMTCAIREGAEAKIWHRLDHLRGFKKRRTKLKNKVGIKIGVLGCMAERLKTKLIESEKSIDVVAGPDSYRDLPRLLALTDNDQAAVNVLLSLDETYADVMPVRLNQDSVTAFVSIMRGCDNMCAYCIVPWTRGRERSRAPRSIVEEVARLAAEGVREVTLLGQNVNSYRHLSEGERRPTQLAKGFSTVYKNKEGGLRFADLLDRVSAVDPNMRIRFTSPHPKDFPDEVLQVISERGNICKALHLPAQSGSSAVLQRMRRGYTRDAYLDLVARARDVIPGVGLSSDFICGFCGETEEEFQDTLSLLESVRYNVAYLFPYSMREKTMAHRRYTDDVPDEVKHDRHRRMVEVYRKGAEALNRAEVGNIHLVLVEGTSKKSEDFLAGRNDLGIKVILGQTDLLCPESEANRPMRPGDFVAVEILEGNSQVLKGKPLRFSSITDFSSESRRKAVI